MNTRDWHDDDISSATDPDEVLRQARLALIRYDERMRRSFARSKARPGSMRELMARKKRQQEIANLGKP